MYSLANICFLPYSERYLKILVGKKEMEDALKRLDKLTQEEARMAAAENLRLMQVLINGTPNLLATRELMLNLNAHALVRRKRNEASGSAVGKQRRRHKMFVIHSVTPVMLSLTLL